MEKAGGDYLQDNKVEDAPGIVLFCDPLLRCCCGTSWDHRLEIAVGVSSGSSRDWCSER